MIKKAVMMFVLLLFCSSIFVFAQETEDIYEDEVEDCGLGCKVWQFLFGSTEARAGRAWFDRSEALVGMAGTSKYFQVVYTSADGTPSATNPIPAETEGEARAYALTEILPKEENQCSGCKISYVLEVAPPPATPASAAPKPSAPTGTSPAKPVAASTQTTTVSTTDPKARALHQEAGELIKAGKFSEALEKENQAIAIEPSNYKVHGRKAEILEKMERYDEAALSYGDVLKVDPNIPDVDKKKTQEKLANANSLYLKQPAANKKLKEGGVKGTLGGEEGTFTLNPEGTKLFFQGKEVNDLSKAQFGAPASSKIDEKAQDQLEDSLGASYSGFEKSVGKVKSIYERPASGQLVIQGSGGELIVDKDAGEDGIREGNRFVN